MGKEATYWIGKGVVRIDGINYGKGEEIPIEKVNSDTAEAWEKNGLTSNAPVAISANASENKDKARIKELESEIVTLKNKRTKGGRCKECPKKDKEIAAFRQSEIEAKKIAEDLIDSNKLMDDRIAELEKQIEELTNPDGGGQ